MTRTRLRDSVLHVPRAAPSDPTSNERMINISVRLPAGYLAIIDELAHQERAKRRGAPYTRSDAVRELILRATDSKSVRARGR